MKKAFVAAAAVLFGLGPALGSACEYTDKASMAGATTSTQVASTAVPAPSRLPSAVVNKATPVKTANPVSENTRQPASDAKLATASGN